MKEELTLSGPPAQAEVALVVNLIRQDLARTRGDLCRLSGFGRNVVSTHLATAVASGLIEKAGTAPSNGGRSPHRWRFVESAGSVLTASIAVHGIRVTRSDLAGNTLAGEMVPWEINNGPIPTLERVEAALVSLVEKHAAPIWGLGVSLPGPIDHESGTPASPPIMKGWDGFDVRGFFESRLHIPVLVDNDVNAMAMGHSVESSDRDSIYVLVSTGIGAGLISHGELHRGAQGAAGDIGHTRIDSQDTVVCRCGRIGCLEASAGGWALERAATRLAVDGLSPYLEAVRQSDGSISIDRIATGVEVGDTSCIELVATAASSIGAILAVLVSFYNPQRIVLAGPIPTRCPLFHDTIMRSIKDRSLALATQNLAIETAPDPEADESRGCALMVVDEAFSRAVTVGNLD